MELFTSLGIEELVLPGVVFFTFLLLLFQCLLRENFLPALPQQVFFGGRGPARLRLLAVVPLCPGRHSPPPLFSLCILNSLVCILHFSTSFFSDPKRTTAGLFFFQVANAAYPS